MTDHDTGAIAERYFSAWLENDWDELRGLLADDVAFRGPLASIDGADELRRGNAGPGEDHDGHLGAQAVR
jgi:ketosteroid isomerase-like protein